MRLGIKIRSMEAKLKKTAPTVAYVGQVAIQATPGRWPRPWTCKIFVRDSFVRTYALGVYVFEFSVRGLEISRIQHRKISKGGHWNIFVHDGRVYHAISQGKRSAAMLRSSIGVYRARWASCWYSSWGWVEGKKGDGHDSRFHCLNQICSVVSMRQSNQLRRLSIKLFLPCFPWVLPWLWPNKSWRQLLHHTKGRIAHVTAQEMQVFLDRLAYMLAYIVKLTTQQFCDILRNEILIWLCHSMQQPVA
jgi:hypothetical protein